MAKIYLLEDDESIRSLVVATLQFAEIQIETFDTVKSFNQAVEEKTPLLVILDIMLPDGNGLDVLKDIKKKHPDTFCIMLSALGQETDKVKGLNLGADDYISKPFSLLEFTARVKAALRRVDESSIISCGDIVLNEDDMTATLKGEKLELNNKEFHLLKYFMQKEGKALTRESILYAVWGYGEGETRTVDNHVARLRKLGINNIQTVFGVGYKFVK